MKTVDLLFDAILKGDNIETPVFCDYFGFQNNNDDNYTIIYGLYTGLIKYKGIGKKLIENCYITNRLDELIHKKYTHHKSKYYKQFVKKNINIGNTYLEEEKNDDILEDGEQNNDNIEKYIIYNDDYCPSCDIIGYYTKNNYELLYNINDQPYQCSKCYIGICKLCCNYDKDNVYCYKCENPNIKRIIENKIKTYNKNDLDKFGIIGNVKIDDVICLLNKQKLKCYVCDDVVLTFGYKPYCLYQFSIDRIDNNLPHNKDNILISCYYCNCIDYFTKTLCNENKKYKICDNNCHCKKRNITVKREDISIDKINLLKLKN